MHRQSFWSQNASRSTSNTIVTHILNPQSFTSKHLPAIIFGSTAVLAGIMSWFLPETRGQKLPDTIMEGEEFGKWVIVYNCSRFQNVITQLVGLYIMVSLVVFYGMFITSMFIIQMFILIQYKTSFKIIDQILYLYMYHLLKRIRYVDSKAH